MKRKMQRKITLNNPPDHDDRWFLSMLLTIMKNLCMMIYIGETQRRAVIMLLYRSAVMNALTDVIEPALRRPLTEHLQVNTEPDGIIRSVRI